MGWPYDKYLWREDALPAKKQYAAGEGCVVMPSYALTDNITAHSWHEPMLAQPPTASSNDAAFKTT
jgi:hypothetical protein